ncbi:hypothetical protein J28TS4_57390 [Paenibacillus lautus]|nr:hypothetical protein J28TS4_57390 [Paenibacillus lautus]
MRYPANIGYIDSSKPGFKREHSISVMLTAQLDGEISNRRSALIGATDLYRRLPLLKQKSPSDSPTGIVNGDHFRVIN